MRQFMMTVMALAAFGAMAATAQAEILHGGPLKNGNQCLKYSNGSEKDGRFGSWGACPKEASVRPAAASQTARPSRSVSAAYQEAMDKCQEMYGGRWMAHQRLLNIEMCFKSLTGKYPAQVNLNRTVSNCAASCPVFVPSTTASLTVCVEVRM
jgi:hypothetical protein